MIQKLSDSIANNKNNILYTLLGASILGGYYYYARHALAKYYDVQLEKKKNLLDTNFAQLLRLNKQPNIMKIVFTQADSSTGFYRKVMIDKIKQLFPQKDLGVLINCSPKKLFDAGCQAFIASFQNDDEEYADYIINFIKSELLIQDTIQKIQNVSQMKQKTPRYSIMLCDNNCLDIKRIKTLKKTYLNDRIVQMALDKLKIKQSQLYDLYECVIHFEEDASTQTQQEKQQNKHIEQLWGNKNFRGFYEKFKYDHKKSKPDNVNPVIIYIHQKIKEHQKMQADQKWKNMQKIIKK